MYTHVKLYTNCYVLVELAGKLEATLCFCWSLFSLPVALMSSTPY